MSAPVKSGKRAGIVSQQLGRPTDFYQRATVQDNDLVKVEQSIQPVRDHDDGAALELGSDDLLDLGVGQAVHAADTVSISRLWLGGLG